MNSIEAVLFDYGMVLSGPPNPDAWAQLATLTGLSGDALRMAYWAERDHYDSGALTSEAYWSGISASAGVTLSPERLLALDASDVRLWTDLNEPMVAWVQALHHAGIKTGILSNLGDAMTAGVRAKFDWMGGFTHTVFSHAHGIRKPEQEIYAIAARGLQTAPEHILFIDDKPENTRAAEEFGMHAVVYRGHDDFLREMDARGLGTLLRAETDTRKFSSTSSS